MPIQASGLKNKGPLQKILKFTSSRSLSDGQGGWRGWGNRYGQDWRPDGPGGLVGAGDNWGQQLRPPTQLQACRGGR